MKCDKNKTPVITTQTVIVDEKTIRLNFLIEPHAKIGPTVRSMLLRNYSASRDN
jgi:hypothetical protein